MKATGKAQGKLAAVLAVAAVLFAARGLAGWKDGPPLPEPRWDHAAAASVDGYVMVFGGRILYGQDRIYGHGLGTHALALFDPQTRTWSMASRMPPYHSRAIYHRDTKKGDAPKTPGAPDPPIEDESMEAWYEAPYGGADAKGRAHYFVDIGSVYFDPRTHTWGQAPAPVLHVYPADRRSVDWIEGTGPSWISRSSGATTTGPDGRLYLIGGTGLTRQNMLHKEPLNGLDIYDPETNTWRRGASMKVARQSLAAAFGRNGKLYVFGGCACLGSIPLYKVGDEQDKERAHAEAMAQRQSVAETEVYDPKTDTWAEAAPMPTPRMQFAAATGADGKIYVIGGKTSMDGGPSGLVEVYDPANDRWSRGPSLRIARTSHTAVTTGDGTIWVVGGYAAPPTAIELSRLAANDKGGPTTSVELLKTTSE